VVKDVHNNTVGGKKIFQFGVEIIQRLGGFSFLFKVLDLNM